MKPHPWFESTTDLVVMSHHGRADAKAHAGSLEALRAAYRAGYRWFQVDVVPIKDDLVSMHAVLGWRVGYRRMNRDQVSRRVGYRVPTLVEILDDPEMRDARWNIEVKSRSALPQLIAVLKRTKAVSRVMVSAPGHPKIVREVRETFGTLVAVAAPVHHGGVFGRLFFTPKLEHDGMQVFRWFGRGAGVRHGRGRVRVQSWTIDGPAHLDACLAAGCHPVVKDSDDALRARLEAIGRWPDVPPTLQRRTDTVELEPRPQTPEPERPARPIEVLMLGGGGWRGAFGSIGSVAYLRTTGTWQHIRHVVAISGGSFVAAALGAEGVDDEQPSPELARLARQMMALRWPMRLAFLPLLIPVALLVTMPFVLDGRWSLLWLLVPTVCLFLGRWIVSLEWRLMMRRLFRGGRPRAHGRRYVVCATGRSSARPYFFVGGDLSDLDPGAPAATSAAATPAPSGAAEERWGRMVPGDWTWADAVVSSTALPWVNGFRTEADPTMGRAGAAERLIDGGVVGIFGRQWFEQTLLGPSTGDTPRTLAIDTGRKHRTGGRWTERLMGFLTIGMLSRWVQIALDASFRKEIERATRAEAAAPPGQELMNLVRVAESDAGDHHEILALRDEVLRRLEHGRCIVRRFGLSGLTRRNCLTTIVVAVVACTVDIEHEPTAATVRERLVQVGRELEMPGELERIWDEL